MALNVNAAQTQQQAINAGNSIKVGAPCLINGKLYQWHVLCKNFSGSYVNPNQMHLGSNLSKIQELAHTVIDSCNHNNTLQNATSIQLLSNGNLDYKTSENNEIHHLAGGLKAIRLHHNNQNNDVNDDQQRIINFMSLNNDTHIDTITDQLNAIEDQIFVNFYESNQHNDAPEENLTHRQICKKAFREYIEYNMSKINSCKMNVNEEITINNLYAHVNQNNNNNEDVDTQTVLDTIFNDQGNVDANNAIRLFTFFNAKRNSGSAMYAFKEIDEIMQCAYSNAISNGFIDMYRTLFIRNEITNRNALIASMPIAFARVDLPTGNEIKESDIISAKKWLKRGEGATDVGQKILKRVYSAHRGHQMTIDEKYRTYQKELTEMHEKFIKARIGGIRAGADNFNDLGMQAPAAPEENTYRTRLGNWEQICQNLENTDASEANRQDPNMHMQILQHLQLLNLTNRTEINAEQINNENLNENKKSLLKYYINQINLRRNNNQELTSQEKIIALIAMIRSKVNLEALQRNEQEEINNNNENNNNGNNNNQNNNRRVANVLGVDQLPVVNQNNNLENNNANDNNDNNNEVIIIEE